MHNIRLPGSRRRAVVVLTAVLLVWASVATVALAADKTFSATVTSNLVAGGTYSVPGRAPIVFTLTDTSNQAELGSANVTVPTGLVATFVSSDVGAPTLNGTVIELRNLNLQPGQSVNVSVWAQVECASNHTPYTWSVQAKQANDFNGTGNDLAGANPVSTVVGNCGLTFSAQPAHAEKTPVAITDTIYDPTGGPVTVTVRDAEGVQTVTWWTGTIDLALGDDPTGGTAALTGGLSGPANNGSVTFTPSIDVSATGYSLIATATPTAGSASAGTSTAGLQSSNFNIVDDATICGTGASGCEASAGQGQKTAATVKATTAGNAGDLVILSIADPTVTLDCGGYVETSDVVVFNITTSDGQTPSGNRAKTATLTLLAQYVTKSASKYQVCYNNGVDDPFLLPTCSNKAPEPPCVVSKKIDSATKNLVIVVSAPAGDPGLKF